jgi:hypothetical protein
MLAGLRFLRKLRICWLRPGLRRGDVQAVLFQAHGPIFVAEQSKHCQRCPSDPTRTLHSSCLR